MLSDKDELNEVNVPYNGKVEAIIINSNDHGYCKVRYDPDTLASFVHSFHVNYHILIYLEN